MKTLKLLFAFSLTIIVVLAGCSNDGAEPEQSPDSNPAAENETGDQNAMEEGDDETEEGSDEPEENESNTSLSADEEAENELKEQENVEDVMVQVVTRDEGNAVNADITVSSEVDGEEAATQYADILKEKYPDHTIDIIIVHEGTVLHQQTFE